MNSHEEINKLLAGFALGELSEEEASTIERHLRQCGRCRVELRRLKVLLECTGGMSELSADEQRCESARAAVLAAIVDAKEGSRPGPASIDKALWKRLIQSRVTKLAAAAVFAIVLWAAIMRPPGVSQNNKWWMGSAWGQEILESLDTIKGVCCREQTIFIMSDGSKHTSGTWDILCVSIDSYRRDIYDDDVLRETQWYVPEGNNMIQTAVRFDLGTYSACRHPGSFGNQDPVKRMRFYVMVLKNADNKRLLGEREIEGRRCVGFQISASEYGDNPKGWLDRIWFDVDTKLPVLREHERPCPPDRAQADCQPCITVQDQFDYEPGLPAGAFIPDIPEG